MDHLVQDHSQRPAITLLTVERAQIGFRRHVGRRAHIEGLDDLFGPDDLAEAEIDDGGVEILINEYIRWFEISVDDAVERDGVAPNQYLFEDIHGFLLAESSLHGNVVFQRAALAQLGDNVAEVVFFQDVVQLDNMVAADGFQRVFLILEQRPRSLIVNAPQIDGFDGYGGSALISIA